MTSGQPPAKIQAEQCERLALCLAERKPRRSLPQALTLFNIGRASTAAFMLFFLLLLWGSGSSHFNLLLPYMAAGLGLILVPFLLLALYQGVRLGLFGLVEFMCGLSYVPMGALGGLPFHRRTFHLLALIYSGVG